MGEKMADEKDTTPFVPKGTDESNDEENTKIDAASSKPLREAKVEEPAVDDSREEPNPPRTTRGFFTAPKFGSAGSGGLELEPGLEKD
jgi:hypothetical protein